MRIRPLLISLDIVLQVLHSLVAFLPGGDDGVKLSWRTSDRPFIHWCDSPDGDSYRVYLSSCHLLESPIRTWQLLLLDSPFSSDEAGAAIDAADELLSPLQASWRARRNELAAPKEPVPESAAETQTKEQPVTPEEPLAPSPVKPADKVAGADDDPSLGGREATWFDDGNVNDDSDDVDPGEAEGHKNGKVRNVHSPFLIKSSMCSVFSDRSVALGRMGLVYCRNRRWPRFLSQNRTQNPALRRIMTAMIPRKKMTMMMPIGSPQGCMGQRTPRRRIGHLDQKERKRSRKNCSRWTV